MSFRFFRLPLRKRNIFHYISRQETGKPEKVNQLPLFDAQFTA
jgi:hypothetical protein